LLAPQNARFDARGGVMQRNWQADQREHSGLVASTREAGARKSGRFGNALSALREKVGVAVPGDAAARRRKRAQPPSAHASRDRLREIIERDRALIAAEPEPSDLEQAGAAGPTSIALEPALESTQAELRAEPPAQAQAQAPDTGHGVSARAKIEGWIAEQIADLETTSPAPMVLAPAEDDSGPREVEQVDRIRTRTMARLLASQGYLARALSIYDELVARDAEDASLRAEAEAVRRKA
jgi:hypothetical protein